MQETNKRLEKCTVYREKANDMLKRSEGAATQKAKAEYVALADHWLRLAQTLEAQSGIS